MGSIVDYIAGTLRFNGPDSSLPWFLVRVIRNRALHIRRCVPRRAPACALVTVAARQRIDEEIEERELATHVSSALEQLPPRIAQAASLHWLRGLTVLETAEEMGTRAPTARAQLHEALTRLRKRIVP